MIREQYIWNYFHGWIQKKTRFLCTKKVYSVWNKKKIEINFCKLQRQGKAFFETSSAALIIPFIEKCINPYVYVTNFYHADASYRVDGILVAIWNKDRCKVVLSVFFPIANNMLIPQHMLLFLDLMFLRNILPLFLLTSSVEILGPLLLLVVRRADYGFNVCILGYNTKKGEFKIVAKES